MKGSLARLLPPVFARSPSSPPKGDVQSLDATCDYSLNLAHKIEVNDEKKTPKPTSSNTATMLQMSHRRHLDFLDLLV
jgi:hypothetical protein